MTNTVMDKTLAKWINPRERLYNKVGVLDLGIDEREEKQKCNATLMFIDRNGKPFRFAPFKPSKQSGDTVTTVSGVGISVIKSFVTGDDKQTLKTTIRDGGGAEHATYAKGLFENLTTPFIVKKERH